MAAITKIEFWSDVGFIDGAVEIPRLNAPDPTNPDVTIEEEILPSKDRFFSELKLKEYYTGLLTMSYMRVTYDLKNSLGIDTPNVFYGWVDSVKLSSDGELPMTIISWHIDEWRTWKSAITFGSGHVKRRPFRALDSTPIQNYQVRYLQLDNFVKSLVPPKKTTDGKDIWWVIFSYNYTDDNTHDTTIRTLFYPFLNGASPLYFNGYVGGGAYKTLLGPSVLNDIYNGRFDELFGIAPEQLNGVWISPVCPVWNVEKIDGLGTSSSPITIKTSSTIPYYNTVMELVADSGYGAFVADKISETIITTFDSPLKSSESERYLVADMNGQRLFDLPYDFEVAASQAVLFCEPDAPYIEISLRDSTLGSLEGVTANIPLPQLPVNENAFSAYVFSGQKEYNNDMRVLRANVKAWESTTQQTANGAMMGAFGPQGFGLGVIGGLVGGLVPYGVDMIYGIPEENRYEERLQSKQLSSLIMSSEALLTVTRSYGITLRKLIPDDYSNDQMIATRNQIGISVDELMSSCDSLIRNTSPTGYYNIQNLIVNGDIPVSAKKWIWDKFRSGVRLI